LPPLPSGFPPNRPLRPSLIFNVLDVQVNSMLNWIPADNAVSHDLSFEAYKDAVKNVTTTSSEFKGNKASGTKSYDPECTKRFSMVDTGGLLFGGCF
jgi:hypothetical protein